MSAFMSGLVMFAVYLAWGPLPVMRIPAHARSVLNYIENRFRQLRTTPAISPIPFLWTLHSEVMAGSLIDVALLRACGTLPPSCIAQTHRALSDVDDVAAALEDDSVSSQLVVLSDLAMIYRICARTGAPITESLMRIMASVADEQRRNRTLAQETASTKASAFVLATLPLLGVMMGVGLGLNPFTWFLQSALGVLCLLCGIGLEIMGWLWVRILMRRAMDPT